MYQVSIRAYNNASLTVSRATSPTVFDDSVPQAGFVAEGDDFLKDVVWWGTNTYVSGNSGFVNLLPNNKILDRPKSKTFA